MSKRNLFFWSLPISPWASFVTWLHLEAPPKNTEKINKYRLSNSELVLTHTVSELSMLGISGKLSVPSITLSKKIQILKKSIAQELPKTQSTIIWLTGILRIKSKFFYNISKPYSVSNTNQQLWCNSLQPAIPSNIFPCKCSKQLQTTPIIFNLFRNILYETKLAFTASLQIVYSTVQWVTQYPVPRSKQPNAERFPWPPKNKETNKPVSSQGFDARWTRRGVICPGGSAEV